MKVRSEILIVDDKKENLHSLEVLLKDVDADIVLAHSGSEALRIMLESDFALVLMDVQMPEMDGFETVRIMRKDQALESTPVIFLSAIYKEDIYLLKGIESGAVDFLIKPIKSELLLGKVRIFLNLFENRKKLELINRTYERELLINQTLSDLAKQLIEPEKTIQMISDSVFKASLLITESKQGLVSEIDRVSGNNIGHSLSEMMSKSYGLEGEVRRPGFSIGKDGKYPGMWEKVLIKGVPLLVKDYEGYSPKAGLPEGHMPIKDFLSVPVKYGEEIIGQIAVTNCRTSYNDLHLSALLKIADLYALAIKRQRDEEDRISIMEEVRQSEKMQVIGQLTGGMAHNFNNILNGILSAAQLLKSKYGKMDKSTEKYTDIIISSSLRAAGITEKLLQYSKKNKVKTELLSPQKIISDCVSILSSTIDSKIQVVEEIEEALWNVLGDRSSIQNVLLNLGLNGSHAIDGDGKIVFKAYNKPLSARDIVDMNLSLKEGDFVCLEVYDSGSGISKENIKQIFKPFFTTKKNGTGLGLSVSYRTVSDHSGAMNVISGHGEGTTFYIYLPAYRGDRDIEIEPEKIIDGTGVILFIDDEEINRITGSELLKSLGYSVYTAENGISALKIYKEIGNSIDLVITDMQMPDMDGLETIKNLYTINANCKVILISGFSEESHSDEINKLQISGFIQKPYRLNDLSQSVSDVLK